MEEINKGVSQDCSQKEVLREISLSSNAVQYLWDKTGYSEPLL